MKQSLIWFVGGFVSTLLISISVSAQTAVTRQVSAEVLKVDGYNLVLKIMPGDDVRTVTVPPGRTATIDDKSMTLDKVVPGTVLTATVTWVPAPGTMSTVTGEVLFVAAPHVSVRLSDGTIKQYTAPPDFTLMVDGRKQTVQDLRPGVKLTAVRLTEDPVTKITPESPVTGKAPKK